MRCATPLGYPSGVFFCLPVRIAGVPPARVKRRAGETPAIPGETVGIAGVSPAR